MSPIARLTASIMLPLLISACVSAPAPQRPVPKPAPRPTPAIVVPVPKPAAPKPLPAQNSAQAPTQLEAELHEIWRAFPGKTGIAVQRIDGQWVTGKRLGEWFPQQSVSKMWVAMTILDQVDSGRLRLDQTVRIGMNDLAVFHQPIRERVVANGAIEASISSPPDQAITASDNTAKDSLLPSAGAPTAVRNLIERKQVGKFRYGPADRL